MNDETKTDLAAAPVSLPAGGRQDSVPLEGTASTRLLCQPDGTQGDPAARSPVLSLAAPVLTVETKPGISISEKDLTKGAERAQLLLAARPFFGKYSLEEIAAQIGTSVPTLCRLRQNYGHLADAELTAERMAGSVRKCGRKAQYLPNDEEMASVRAIYSKLDESQVRGLGLGSSRIGAFRLAAKSDDPRITPIFKAFILNRRTKTVPKSWLRLLDLPANALEYGRDKRSTMAAYISTPRSRVWIDEDGNKNILTAGDISEADDGTLNFYATIPWPFGGDKCSEKFGVKLGRWQLLAGVDVASEMCPTFDIVARNFGSYRGEDVGALLGRMMIEECIPEIFRLERGSWESNFVNGLLDLVNVPRKKAWHSKQKSVVERFFDRLWTPASLIRGHVGRDRGRNKQVTDLALACQDGRRDPRDHFLSFEQGAAEVMKAVQFVNSEPIESRSGWGRWVPQERYTTQLAEQPRQKLDASQRIFFSREQKTWTVRKGLLGGSVDSPLIKFPTYFQCEALAMFEGCKVKAYFDPYADEVTGTLVLQHEWRGHRAGHVIATGVAALDLPPQAVLAEDGWSGADACKQSLAVRKAMSKAVRAEYCNWRGERSGEARDGMGNVAKRNGATAPATLPARVVRATTQELAVNTERNTLEMATRRERNAEDAEIARNLIRDD